MELACCVATLSLSVTVGTHNVLGLDVLPKRFIHTDLVAGNKQQNFDQQLDKRVHYCTHDDGIYFLYQTTLLGPQLSFCGFCDKSCGMELVESVTTV